MSEPIQSIAQNNYILQAPPPTSTMFTTELEYDGDKISGYAGSAFKAGDEFPISADEAVQYVQTNSAGIDDTITNVTTNSGAWGGSALPISAGPGIKVNLVDNTLVFSNDETVLWEGVFTTATSGITLSEVADNFEKLKFVHNWNGNGTWGEYDETIVPVSAASAYKITLSHIVQIASTGAPANVYYTTNTIAFESTANNKFVHIGGYRSNFAGSNTSTTDITRITKILGINRKQ